MSAVAAQVHTVRRNAPAVAVPRAATRRLRQRARRASRLGRALRLAIPLACLAFLFTYAGVYAQLAVTSYHRSKLMNQLRQEKIRYERLRVDYIRRSSPAGVMGAAQRGGMVYATQYDYLRDPAAVARAGAR